MAGIVGCPPGRATTVLIILSLLSVASGFSAAIQPRDTGNCSSPDFACDQHSLLAFRSKRQAAPACNKRQWQCKDGQCIPRTKLCNGVINCADGSDEQQAACIDHFCPDRFFRCTYGACITQSAKCNAVQDCADRSDEYHSDCTPPRPTKPCGKRDFKCDNNQCIKATKMCNGVTDCEDGSDETVIVCADMDCSYYHQCAYGACVNRDARCNNIVECADKSDEDSELCKGVAQYVPTTPGPPPASETRLPASAGDCAAPELPDSGSYIIVTEKRTPAPGTVLEEFTALQYFCYPRHQLNTATDTVWCQSSQWNAAPVCLKGWCKGQTSTTVDLTCTSGIDGRQTPCNQSLPNRSTMHATCKNEHIGNSKELTCSDGEWDGFLPTCIQDCGQETSKGKPFIFGGTELKNGEFPWHVGLYIFKDNDATWEQICGGSIIRNDYIMTAAHCVWDKINHRAYLRQYFRVGAGKFYRDYYDETDAKKDHVQFFGVARIHIASEYRGSERSFRNDMALLLLDKLINFSEFVRPVCLEYNDLRLDSSQTSPGLFGKVAGWGLTSPDKKSSSPELITASLRIVSINTCLRDMPENFERFITSDKFCAGYTNGTTLCQGDSGGGLVVSSVVHGATRWYLRGIVSIGVIDEISGSCMENFYTTFTHVIKLSDWISSVLE